MMADSVIEVSGLHKAYGRTVAVDDVSFDVRRGEIFGLIGPNGAGKTTSASISLSASLCPKPVDGGRFDGGAGCSPPGW